MGNIEKDLEQTKQMVVDIISITISQYDSMYKCLETSDSDLAQIVIKTDIIINKMQEAFVEVSLWKIVKQQMVAGDLRRIIGYISVVHELERIADYSKNICRFYIKYKPSNKLVCHLQRLLAKFKEMLFEISKIFDNENLELAYIIPSYDFELDQIYKIENKNLIEMIRKSKSKKEINLITSTMQQLKYIERAGDHIINIAEALIFIIEGHSYDFDKPV